jgi:molybdopterin molybdotransferase
LDRTRPSQGRAGSVEEAWAWIDALAAPLGPEQVPVAEAAGRILAEEVRAAFDLPPFDRAAVDGLAVRADETVGAGAYNPLPFRLAPAAGGELPAGAAVRLDAGEPLPRGADAVVPLDRVGAHDGAVCEVIEAVVAGNEVERAGAHGARGDVAVGGTGRRLGPGDIGVLASAGLVGVAVAGRPRVRCLVMEGAVDAGVPLPAGAVYDADGPMLGALIARDGGVAVARARVARDRAALCDALGGVVADMVLVVGGTGRGSNDHAAAALAEAGELAIHGVALRPGETAGLGRTAAGVPVVLLPGAPAACLWAYEMLAGRAIRRLGGHDPALPFARVEMTAARKIVSELGMTEVCAVRCVGGGGAEPLAPFAEAGLKAVTEGDGFVLVPEGSEGYQKGAAVTVYLYDERGRAQS